MNRKKCRSLWLVRLAGLALLLVAVATVSSVATVAGAGGQKQESQVKLTATAGKVDAEGRQVVTITMDINAPWHAYANPVHFEDLEAAQTTVKITSAAKLADVKIAYPPGKLYIDDLRRYRHYIYEGKVEIQASVKRASGDTGPLDVSVKYMTCKKNFCLPPEQVILQVK
jgi:DsbC/DsbD-like thiol-disulfide interchange protein